ncbi:HTH domain-containing protein [Hymenobacter sp. NBH84]|uniref:HTH domain-containing protein n=1 Tax=Hymenobacter sp. NBH84 TaxID=2596915 RepID=UPI0016267215|nr:HTH domain-containing protein [Hymenobacter sp. NBH84]
MNAIQKKLQPVLRTRTRKGVKTQYLVPPKAVSDGAQATGRVLLKWQLEAISEARQVPFLRLQVATDAAPTPPPVATNCEELARYRNVSGRTIRNHLRELETCGVIVRRKFRGTHADFELWLSTKLLWKTDSAALQPMPVEESTLAEQAEVVLPSGTNFPLIEGLEKQYKEEIEIGPVDKLVSDAAGSSLTGNTGPRHTPKPTENGPHAALKAPSAEKESEKPGGAAAPAHVEKPQWLSTCREMAAEFYQKALRVLYARCSYSEQEHRQIKLAIWQGVYHGFGAQLTPRQWHTYHDQALERLDLAAGYFRRHPDKFAPKPYAEFVLGTGYFDYDNQRGFVGTLDWHAKQLARNHQRDVLKALRRARREMRAHRLRQAPERVQQMTPLQLYRYHENKLRQLGAAALREFHAQVAAPRA